MAVASPYAVFRAADLHWPSLQSIPIGPLIQGELFPEYSPEGGTDRSQGPRRRPRKRSLPSQLSSRRTVSCPSLPLGD